MPPQPDPRLVRILINPKSGLGVSLPVLLEAFSEAWDCDGRRVSFQMSQSIEDGRLKARQAVEEGVGILIVVGGDGMINTVGSQLLDSGVALGVVPTGSGNGFARHFGIPLQPSKAVHALVGYKPLRIDVGTANGRPFFVTCSLAWDAALVRTFEKSPIRGILPYIFAAAYELFDYQPEEFRFQRDDLPEELAEKPMLFTIANLTQFGGGAQIAPQAMADDGLLWLTWADRADVPKLIPQLPKLFDGTIDQVPEIHVMSLKTMIVRRTSAQPIQLDGEVVESGARVDIAIRPGALTVLAPGV